MNLKYLFLEDKFRTFITQKTNLKTKNKLRDDSIIFAKKKKDTNKSKILGTAMQKRKIGGMETSDGKDKSSVAVVKR